MKNLTTIFKPKVTRFTSSKLKILLSFLCFILWIGQTAAQNSGLTLKMCDAKIEDVIREIEKQSNYRFIYNNELVNVDSRVSVNVTNQSVKDILNQIFKDKNIQYEIKNFQIILTPKNAPANTSQNRSRIIRGRVIDENGEELPGVSIYIKETNTSLSNRIHQL